MQPGCMCDGLWPQCGDMLFPEVIFMREQSHYMRAGRRRYRLQGCLAGAAILLCIAAGAGMLIAVVWAVGDAFFRPSKVGTAAETMMPIKVPPTEITAGSEENQPMDPLMLVNFACLCPEEMPTNLVAAESILPADVSAARPDILLDADCAAALAAMLTAATEDGVGGWILSSGYRDHAYQQALYDRKRAADPHYADDPYAHPVSVMPPRTSEHATGLAVDLTVRGYEDLTEDFASTEQGTWLAVHCTEYGFILRYPRDKESVTGVVYEPWHFRYVGSARIAREITESGLCLEEYLAVMPRE